MSSSSSSSSSSSLAAYVWTGAFFMSSSVAMHLVNKLVIIAFNFPFALLWLQNTVSLALLIGRPLIVALAGACRTRILGHQPTGRPPAGSSASLASALQLGATPWRDALWCAPSVLMFTIMLVTSLAGMRRVSVPTVVVFRNLNSYFVALGDVLLLGRRLSRRLYASLGVIAAGSLLYALRDLNFDALGYVYVGLNTLLLGCNSLYIKYMQRRRPSISSQAMSVYNNALSLLPLGALALAYGEVGSAPQAFVAELDGVHRALVLLSCLLGLCMSYSAFVSQRVYSATGWMVLNNLNKVPTVVLGAWFFRSPLSLLSGTGLVVSVGGAFLFAYESYAAGKRAPARTGASVSASRRAQ